MTTIVGQVGDGPIPANVLWTVTNTDGGCKLETPSAPFCNDGCGADGCVDTDTCQAYPTGHSVGDVALKGIMLSAGGADLALKEIAKAYQPPAGTALAYPPFTAGDDVTLHATGGDYTAFDLATKGIDSLTFTSTDFELEISAALITDLIGLGVAGFPSVVMMREAIATTNIAPGIVRLDVSSRAEHYVTVKGVDSCTTDDDCPSGKTCRTLDSTCQ